MSCSETCPSTRNTWRVDTVHGYKMQRGQNRRHDTRAHLQNLHELCYRESGASLRVYLGVCPLQPVEEPICGRLHVVVRGPKRLLCALSIEPEGLTLQTNNVSQPVDASETRMRNVVP
jgi:hypothetical protein